VDLTLPGDQTLAQVCDWLEERGLPVKGYVNWYAFRWPHFSFVGGVVMGNEPTDMEFFYQEPFRWWNAALESVMDGGGGLYGVRVVYRGVGGPPDIDCQPPGCYAEGYKRSVGPGYVQGGRSYLLFVRGETMAQQGYCPSYVLANGRRIWDSKLHRRSDGKIYAPFWVEKDCNALHIDMVVDLDYTPDVKGLAFRCGHLQFLGRPGCKVSLAGAAEQAEGTPVDRLKRFVFGVFPSEYDFWTERGPTFEWIEANWKPNFAPEYPTDELWLSPMLFRWKAEGAFHDFMVTYGGCNILANDPSPEILRRAPVVRGVLAQSVPAAKTVLERDPDHQVHWMGGEHGVIWLWHGEYGKLVPHASEEENVLRMAEFRQKVADDKQATGAPERVKYIYEPFPPALTCAREYERGADILVIKNEEDPQYNILMSMGRGAGRTFGKPFGFYWEQSHYPYPSMDMKLQACLLYFLAGGSWIGAEAEWAPAFNKGIVAEWVWPYVQAMRFAMVHPARGEPVVPVGVVWGWGDRWWIPYNALGAMDTFQCYVEYDHATRSFTCKPAFVERLHYMPEEPDKWEFSTAGHLPYFHGHVDELKGYDLLDVFFPEYGDAFTARISRLMTGTPHGPVDFVYGEQVSDATLQTYGLLAVLGRAQLTPKLADKLARAAEAGASVVVGAQHYQLGDGERSAAFGLTIDREGPAEVSGLVAGESEVYGGAGARFAGGVCAFAGQGWQTVASVAGRPVIIRKALGAGQVYVYLGQWIHQGGAALRPLLKRLGETVAPLGFSPADDQIEYVAYRKGAGAWVALFNHGNIPVGCDRLKDPRATPPEPLVSEIKGPYRGRIEFRPVRLGLDPKAEFVLYEVDGIDGKAFEGVISGHKTFQVKEVASKQEGGVLKAAVRFDKRAQYLIAPKGRGKAVFFGPGTAASD